MYQTLDNLDGKQARKTGTWSQLGTIFDHWLDTWSLFIYYIYLWYALSIDDNSSLILLIFTQFSVYIVYV